MWGMCRALLRIRPFTATCLDLECPPFLPDGSKLWYLHIWFNREDLLSNKDSCHINVFCQRTDRWLPSCIFAAVKQLYWGLVIYNTLTKFNDITPWILTTAPAMCLDLKHTRNSSVSLCRRSPPVAGYHWLGPHRSSLSPFLLLFLSLTVSLLVLSFFHLA